MIFIKVYSQIDSNSCFLSSPSLVFFISKHLFDVSSPKILFNKQISTVFPSTFQ